MIKQIIKNSTIFVACGIVYIIIELLYRGYTSLSMFFCAGAIGLLASLVNNLFSFEILLQWQLAIGTGIATFCEGVTGLMLVVIYGYNPVWDYSRLPFTFFWGQCNFYFCLIWTILCFVAILIGDSIEYYLFDGKRAYYKVAKNKIWFWLPKKR